jgi:hypothetical protein
MCAEKDLATLTEGVWTFGVFLSDRLRHTLSTANRGSGFFRRRRGDATGVVATPGAREPFTPRELAEAYEAFLGRGPQYLDAETGIKTSVYRFGERVLLLYEESEMGLVTLVDLTSRKKGYFRSLD